MSCTCGETAECDRCAQRIAAAEDAAHFATPLDYDRGADWHYPLDYPF